MDLAFSTAEIAFRQEVRAFIASHYPAWLREKQLSGAELGRDDLLAWHRILAKKGWAAPAWPVEYGGSGWTATERYLYAEESAAADVLLPLPFGISMVGPVLYTFGTEAQKRRHLPGILAGDVWWCQGYSEPGAGSDLASLRTRAERLTGADGREYYRVNGQKTWTTLAQYADWGFFLVRTDSAARPQQGISFLLIDMKTPGITVKPIRTLDGGHEVNEVWLEDVLVPVENRVHHENAGWTCAKFLLAHERTGIAGVAQSKRGLEQLKAMAKTADDGQGGALLDDPQFRRRLLELDMDLTALEFTELRALATGQGGPGGHLPAPGAESSLLKVKGTEIQQRLSELVLEAAGPYALAGDPAAARGANEAPVGPGAAHRAALRYFNLRKTSIYGGSNEIQRNILAKMLLGL